MTLKFFLGVFILGLAITSIILNCVIMAPVFYLAFIGKKSSVYVIAFFNIISDLVLVSLTGFILSTSIIADRYLIVGDRLSDLNVFIGFIFLQAWFMECSVQILMSTNRFAVLTLNKNSIFTFRNTLLMFIFAFFLTGLSAYCMQYSLPCCTFVADHRAMSFISIIIDGIYPYSNVMILCYDGFGTVLSVFCYASVFISIRKSHQNVASNVQKARASQDYRYLLQFVSISIFYIFTWTFFEVLNHISIDVPLEFWSIVSICLICNCSSNAIIFLIFNREIQKLIRNTCFPTKGAAIAPSNNQVLAVVTVDN